MPNRLDVQLLPARSDNYIYLLLDPVTGLSGVVDPADAEPVERALANAKRGLDWIINTHHHDDHTAGNLKLKKSLGAKIAAPAADRHRIEGVDVWLNEGDRFAFAGHEAQILATPGHTSGHISLWFEHAGLLFSGDTLFALGCGRLFEGTPEQMWDSLAKYDSLPDSTIVYCGHEYTQSNAKFALTIDPDNAALKARADKINELRKDSQPTIPTQLGIERATNPFLRAGDPAIRATLNMQDATDAEVFAEIRRRKDRF